MKIRGISPLRNKDTLLGTILLLSSLIFLMGVAGFPDTAARYRSISPSFFPNILGAALAVLSILLLVEGLRKAPGPLIELKATEGGVRRAVILLVLLGLFLGLFRLLGFVITSFLFTAGLQLILGEKRILRALLISGAVTGVLYLLFVTLLRVPLPLGIFLR